VVGNVFAHSRGGTHKKTGICVRKMPLGSVVLWTILSDLTRSTPFHPLGGGTHTLLFKTALKFVKTPSQTFLA